MVASTETRPPVVEGSVNREDFRREMDEYLERARVEFQRYYTEVEANLGAIAAKYGVERPDSEHVRNSLLPGIATDEVDSRRWWQRRGTPSGAESARRRRGGRLGTGAIAAGAGAWLGSRYATRRMQFSDRFGRPMRERYERQSRGRKVALAAGALVVGYLTYKFGEVTIFDFGDGKDKGIDLLPDFLDGHDGGVDFNARNESNLFNDDPVKSVDIYSKEHGPDLLPSFIDGDGYDVFSGSESAITDDPGARPTDVIPDVDVDLPDVDVDPPPDIDVEPDIDVVPDLPEPDVDLTPDVPEPAAPAPPPPAPDPWQPDTFYVQPGSGFEREIHELGHELVGQQFTGLHAHEVYIDTVNTFGAELLQGAEGNEMYTTANNWISRPGLAQWDSPEIERFIHDRVREVAGV